MGREADPPLAGRDLDVPLPEATGGLLGREEPVLGRDDPGDPVVCPRRAHQPALLQESVRQGAGVGDDPLVDLGVAHLEEKVEGGREPRHQDTR